MLEFSNEELQEIVARDYGFQKELIENPKVCGLWCVRFEVNGIKYCGSIPYAGAKPMLSVDGYIANHFWHGTPITEEYYYQIIKGKKIALTRWKMNRFGEWERTGKEFDSVEEAEQFIAELPDPRGYSYELIY